MPRVPYHAPNRLPLGLSLVVGLLALSGACTHAPEVDTVLHEAQRGSVYLERIPDRGFKAAHPVAIEESVIARTLSGVMVTERKTALQTAFSKQLPTNRAFSEEDVRFLVPFLAAALRQATGPITQAVRQQFARLKYGRTWTAAGFAARS